MDDWLWLLAVAEIELCAITAIKDMEQEGSIAASLHRTGWKVIYRATSPELLIQNLERYPEAVLLLSDDFMDPREIARSSVALLRGCTEAISAVGVAPPRSDFELGELLRGLGREKEAERILIPATQSQVIAFASTQGGVGTTSLAINVADQISTHGEKVLLVDACSGRGSIAEHFEVHDIRSATRELSEELSLYEVSDFAQLVHLAKIAASFDYIILDFGILHEESFSGARIRDQIFQWIVHSQSKVMVISGSNQKAVKRNLQCIREIRSSTGLRTVESVFTLDAPLSRRDRAKLESENSEGDTTRISTVSRDSKSLRLAQERATTLRLSAPRSLVLREIGRFVTERVIQK